LFEIQNFFRVLVGQNPLEEYDCIVIMHHAEKQLNEVLMKEFHKKMENSKLCGIVSHLDSQKKYKTESDVIQEILDKYKISNAWVVANINRKNVLEGIICDFPLKYRHYLLKSYLGILSTAYNNFLIISTPELIAKRIKNLILPDFIKSKL
jgi:hypothetical protein